MHDDWALTVQSTPLRVGGGAAGAAGGKAAGGEAAGGEAAGGELVDVEGVEVEPLLVEDVASGASVVWLLEADCIPLGAGLGAFSTATAIPTIKDVNIMKMRAMAMMRRARALLSVL